MTTFVPLAVVGVSALFPGSQSAGGFWRDILRGRDLLTEVPASHWLIEDYYSPDPAAPDKTYARRGAFLQDVAFDPIEFGVPPNIVPATDTSQLLALIVAQKVLEDATQGQFESFDRERVSVILGVTSGQELIATLASRLQKPVWLKALRESGIPEDEAQRICERIASHYQPWQEASFPGMLGNVVAGRIANRFDLRGTNCVVDAACASSLSALQMAANELMLGQSDLVITGGVDTMNDIFMFTCFSKTPALSRTGDCRPFAEGADGTMLGEGLGMFALKRLADAERDNDRVYAVLKAIGTSSDGRSKSIYAPVPAGQSRALQRAYALAGYGPDTVELVEAHGTGTKAGDLAEFTALRQTFEQSGRQDGQWCAIGSVKSQVGHTKAASGAAGLFKAIMALHHKILPPTIKVERPDPQLDIESSPFYLNTSARPWVRGSQWPRRASVSSFGFGGTNFHATLEEYRGPGQLAKRLRSSSVELVVLAAADAAALSAQCRSVSTAVSCDEELVWCAYRSQKDFRALHCRLAIVASSVEDLHAKLAQAAAAIDNKPAEPFSTPSGMHYAAGASAGKIAFLFPGQGSQYAGMGADLAMGFDQARAVWDTAADLGLSLHEVAFPKPAFSEAESAAQRARLIATENAQPAIGAMSLSLLAILEGIGLRPDFTGGHSFGEITALCAAGVLDAASVLQIARRRGELMAQAAAVPGAMIAVNRSSDEVRLLLAAWDVDVVVANHNHPQQAVLSGATGAIEEAEARLRAAHIESKRLAVSTAFHSPLVADAVAPFAAFLDQMEFRTATTAVYSGAEAAPYPAAPAEMRARLARQIAQPIRFVEQIEAMYASGARLFVEVGPGAVLSGFVSRSLAGRPHLTIACDHKGKNGQLSLWEALGRLLVAGVPLDLGKLWERYLPLPDPGARRKRTLSISINGSNYGKPYPPPGGTAALPPPNPPAGTARPANWEAVMPATSAISSSLQEPAIVSSTESHPSPVAAGTHDRDASYGTPVTAGVARLVPSEPLDQVQLACINACQQAQRLAVEAHAAHQRALAESYAACMRVLETSSVGLLAALTGKPAVAAPAANPLPGVAPPMPAGADAPRALPVEWPAATAAIPAASDALAPTPPHAGGIDLQQLLMEVVAEKTGYPVDMLEPHMELEADLGIDSIKQVEILAALKARAPALPEVDPAELGALRSLRQVMDHLHSNKGATLGPSFLPAKEDVETPSPLQGGGWDGAGAARHEPGSTSAGAGETRAPQAFAADGAAHSGRAAAPAADDIDLQRLLMEVVAEKTGYPVDMLEPHMELEADLGIDSIKQVEILAALKARAPALPEVDPAELGALRSLRQIIDYLGKHQRRTDDTARSAQPLAAVRDSGPGSSLHRLVVREVAAPAIKLPMAMFTGSVAITRDGNGLAEALQHRLTRHGLDVHAVDQVPADAAAVIFLGGLRTVDNADDAIAVERQAFAAAKAVAKRFQEDGGVFVTVQDTGGDFGLSCTGARAWLVGIAALARTAALEWPRACVKAIDIERGTRSVEALAEAIETELFEGGRLLEVGLHADGRRTTLQMEESEVEQQTTARIDEQSVIIATGGGQGVTASALVELARRVRPRIALLGRTLLSEEPAACRGISDDAALKRALLAAAKADGRDPTPAQLGAEVARIQANRQIAATLAAIRAAGSQVRYLSVDVRDAAALAAALDSMRQDWGPITGVIHGAGVIDDKRIAEKTKAQFDRVFDTKVEGLRALLAATADDPLALLCMFSSVAARNGNIGQSDYAMANEVLNGVAAAEYRRRNGQCLVRSIGWGPWEGGMVTPALRTHFARQGVALIPLDVGAKALVTELQSPAGGGIGVILMQREDAHRAGGALREPSVLEIHVGAATHPYLAAHSINGKPVVPVALAIEWLARAVQALRPDSRLATFRNIQVLRGIKLHHFFTKSECLRVVCHPMSADSERPRVIVELQGKDGAVHYRSEAELASGHAPASAMPASPAAITLAPWPGTPIYDGEVLFHGPAFHAVRSIEGIAEPGCAGTLVGMRQLGWVDEGWLTDVAVADGGLQLAVLWAQRVLRGASLPTAIAAYRVYENAVPDEPIRCVVRGKEVRQLDAMCDIDFLDQNGALIAEMHGVELHLRPGEPLAQRAEEPKPLRETAD